MNDQEFFTKAVTHCLTQGVPALDKEGNCAYRTTTDEGAVIKCAVGGVLPDHILDIVFTKSCNGAGAERLLGNVEEAAVFFAGVDPQLMIEVQNIHDTYSPSEWQERFRWLAQDRKLEMPTV